MDKKRKEEKRREKKRSGGEKKEEQVGVGGEGEGGEKKEGTARHRERMKKQKARMIIRHAHQKYRFPSRDRGYDSGLSCLFPRLCRNDFRQTKSLDRTALQSINARGPSSTSLSLVVSLPRNKKFRRTDLSRPDQKDPGYNGGGEGGDWGSPNHVVFRHFTSTR